MSWFIRRALNEQYQQFLCLKFHLVVFSEDVIPQESLVTTLTLFLSRDLQ